MDLKANTISLNSNRLTFETPLGTRITKALSSLVWLLAMILLPPAFAFTIYILAIALGSPVLVAYIPAAVTYALSIRLGWQLVTAPIRFRIVLGPEAVEIGGGWLRRRYSYDEVEAISLPEHREGYGVAVEGGTSGAFVHLTADDESCCAMLLREKCKNAIFVDQSGHEYLPPTADQPLMSLGALYRRNRWLALGSIIPTVFLGAMCVGESMILGCVVVGFSNPPALDVFLLAIKLSAESIGLVFLVRFGSRRMEMTREIRAKMVEFQQNKATK